MRDFEPVEKLRRMMAVVALGSAVGLLPFAGVEALAIQQEAQFRARPFGAVLKDKIKEFTGINLSNPNPNPDIPSNNASNIIIDVGIGSKP